MIMIKRVISLSWYDCLDRTKFLKDLYLTVPEIDSVRIESITCDRELTIATIKFDMPTLPDVVPAKWKNKSHDHVCVTIEMTPVTYFSAKYSKIKSSKGGITIINNNGDYILKVIGCVEATIQFDYGYIKNINPY